MSKNLIDEVQKTIQDEQDNKKLEVEKQQIRAMLGLIDDREKRVLRIQEEIKKLNDKLKAKDYSPVQPIRQNYIKFYGNGRTWTYSI